MANANWREKSHCNIIMAFDAIVTGIIEFDVERGILVRSSTETFIKVSIGGIQMPITSTVVPEILP